MTTKLIAGGALTGLILAGSVATMVSAQTAAEATNLTEDQIIEIALLEVPGEVTEVDLEERRGAQFYEVEVVADDGTETELKIDADTGDILKVKADGAGCDREDEDDDDDDAEGEDA